MAFPRLKPSSDPVLPPKKPSRINFKSNSRTTPAKNQETSGKIATASRQDEDDAMQQRLAREEEILSLLTALNAPVLNAELPATLQAVKAHLYARNYSAAFGQPVSVALEMACTVAFQARSLTYVITGLPSRLYSKMGLRSSTRI